ncbi:MAG: hypothetical protein IKR73_08255 [Oscillospiraceae bacterium]|nr:hypothetical protein [Oscillospiraceae bacterium]
MKVSRIIKGWLWWLAGEFICLLFTLCMIMPMQRSLLLMMFTGVSSVLIVNGLYFNFAHNCAAEDRNAVKFHKAPYDRAMPVKLALLAPLPQYLMWIALLLSKAGVIRDIFNIYILANIQCLAWVDQFTRERTIDVLSWGGLFGLLLLVLAAPITIIVTYELVYREIDIAAILMYGKKDK